MSKRRSHSSIDRLPAALRGALTRMVVDAEWPADFGDHPAGKPRYEDVVAYCYQQGHPISASAVGRWAQPLVAMARMKQKGLIVSNVMQALADQNASETQKAAAELMTARCIDLIITDDQLTPKQIADISKAFKDCAYVSISSDKYVREQIVKKAEAAAKNTKKKLTAAGVNRKLIQSIIDEHLGVTKS